jgi:5-methylcytosine-specific restriction endonuclease McrA
MTFNPDGHPPLKKSEALELFFAKKAPDKKLQAKYHRTEWFRALKAQVETNHKTCVLCGRDLSLVPHHRHYKTLFREHPLEDLTLLCSRCHGKHHRGSRR